MSEQAPLFEVVTEPLDEQDDSFGRFIGWNELAEQFGWTPQMFNEDHDGAMSPVAEEASDDGSPEQLMHDRS